MGQMPWRQLAHFVAFCTHTEKWNALYGGLIHLSIRYLEITAGLPFKGSTFIGWGAGVPVHSNV